MPLPIIDLFAGPGGLGEGFSSLCAGREAFFKIALSIEKDSCAHKTLELRAFFRQFPRFEVPRSYYDYLEGRILREDLFQNFGAESERAKTEAWQAELGHKEFDNEQIDARIREALGHRVNWVLIGGPPCQAYSVVGRARRKNDPNFSEDKRHFLYQEYLRILAVHQPTAFVMENVKGLLSAKVGEESIFQRILGDLKNPVPALLGHKGTLAKVSYRIYSLVLPPESQAAAEPEDFVVCAEKYGIPQARHRVILLGVRAERKPPEGPLSEERPVAIEDMLRDLPRVRSGVSREADSVQLWHDILSEILGARWLEDRKLSPDVREQIEANLRHINWKLERGSEFLEGHNHGPKRHRDWFFDHRLHGVCNHSTRSHIREDLHRYFFVSSFGQVHRRSPLLKEFPPELLPVHKNVPQALKNEMFNDRFRVQISGRPSTTITSHISRDGHYFIHYDPTQCRSLTVREAARLQTFPDNYFFEGPRTQQYLQVGNAVPPLLARKIAEIVARLF